LYQSRVGSSTPLPANGTGIGLDLFYRTGPYNANAFIQYYLPDGTRQLRQIVRNGNPVYFTINSTFQGQSVQVLQTRARPEGYTPGESGVQIFVTMYAAPTPGPVGFLPPLAIVPNFPNGDINLTPFLQCDIGAIPLINPVNSAFLTRNVYQGIPLAFPPILTTPVGGVTFAAVNLPAGLLINPATGIISGTTLVAPGNYLSAVYATNADGTGMKDILFKVIDTTPVITSSPLINGGVGSYLRYQITASFEPDTFNCVPLPAGLLIDPLTGIIDGIPIAAGTTAAVISATNPIGTGVGPLTFLIVTPTNPPVVTGSPAVPGYVQLSPGQAISYQVTATNFPTSYTAPDPAFPLGGIGPALNPSTGIYTATADVVPSQWTTYFAATNGVGTGGNYVTFKIV